MKIHSMWGQYPQLQAELVATNELLEKNITIKNQAVREAILARLLSGGKMLRPAYCLLFSYFSSQRDAERAQAIAAAVELLHTATLMHDDVIDEAGTRRGQTTMNRAFGNQIAVYAGDYLFTVCFRLLSQYADNAAVLKIDTNGMESILIGELNQMDMRYNPNMRMRDYLLQIQGKTAQLFALSCYAGAYGSDEDEKLAQLAYRIGHNIGMAFQVMDDVLDYTQDEKTLGKPALSDFRNGIYTAPVLYAMQADRKAFAAYVAKGADVTAEELAEIHDLVERYGGNRAAQALAKKYTTKALKLIKKLPDASVKETLTKLTEQLLYRNM